MKAPAAILALFGLSGVVMAQQNSVPHQDKQLPVEEYSDSAHPDIFGCISISCNQRFRVALVAVLLS